MGSDPGSSSSPSDAYFWLLSSSSSSLNITRADFPTKALGSDELDYMPKVSFTEKERAIEELACVFFNVEVGAVL